MKAKFAVAAAAVGVMLAIAPGAAGAATYTGGLAASGARALTDIGDSQVQTVQHYRGGGRAYGGGGGRPYAYRGGGPGWGYRPWYRRPYYGTIIGGIALGTIVGVTAYGFAPPRPRPDMCWYWADEVQSRGYWDYC